MPLPVGSAMYYKKQSRAQRNINQDNANSPRLCNFCRACVQLALLSASADVTMLGFTTLPGERTSTTFLPALDMHVEETESVTDTSPTKELRAVNRHSRVLFCK